MELLGGYGGVSCGGAKGGGWCGASEGPRALHDLVTSEMLLYVGVQRGGPCLSQSLEGARICCLGWTPGFSPSSEKGVRSGGIVVRAGSQVTWVLSQLWKGGLGKWGAGHPNVGGQSGSRRNWCCLSGCFGGAGRRSGPVFGGGGQSGSQAASIMGAWEEPGSVVRRFRGLQAVPVWGWSDSRVYAVARPLGLGMTKPLFGGSKWEPGTLALGFL